MDLPAKRYKQDHIDAIVRHIESDGEYELTEFQKELMFRAQFADEKCRDPKNSKEQIANFIKNRFEVSRDTAFRIIGYAEAIYSTSRPLHKLYEIQNRIEYLKKKIHECYVDKLFYEAAQLEKVLFNYYKIYPEVKERRSPKNITYNIQMNFQEPEISVNEALDNADEIIKSIEDKEQW